MPHPNAPLSYDVSKHVLRHMDPNKRVLLVIRCPELKARERELPQTMESVSIGPARITINNTTYQLGVIRQYREGAVIPERHLEMNNKGGEHHDVDKYGFKIPTPEVAPGDFPLSVVAPLTEEEIRRDLENIIRWFKQRLDKKKKERKDTRIRRNLWSEEDPESTPGLKELDEAIAEVEADILPFQLRMDNNDKDIPFTLFLQLTISTNGPDGRKVQAIERMEYTGNLGPATKYLIGRLMQKPMNYVNELIVAPLTNRDCFWLPAPLSLSVRHFTIDNYFNLVLTAFGDFSYLKNSRKLKTWRVVLPACPDYVDFAPVINNLLTNGAKIGSCRTAYTSIMQSSVWYNSMKRREGSTVAETPTRGCECLYDCVILPMPNNAQLEFFITPIKNHPHPFQFHLEVQPRN